MHASAMAQTSVPFYLDTIMNNTSFLFPDHQYQDNYETATPQPPAANNTSDDLFWPQPYAANAVEKPYYAPFQPSFANHTCQGVQSSYSMSSTYSKPSVPQATHMPADSMFAPNPTEHHATSWHPARAHQARTYPYWHHRHTAHANGLHRPQAYSAGIRKDYRSGYKKDMTLGTTRNLYDADYDLVAHHRSTRGVCLPTSKPSTELSNSSPSSAQIHHKTNTSYSVKTPRVSTTLRKDPTPPRKAKAPAKTRYAPPKVESPNGTSPSSRGSRTPDTSVQCDWPNCSRWLGRLAELDRHRAEQHFPECGFTAECPEPGCSYVTHAHRSYRGKFQSHIRNNHQNADALIEIGPIGRTDTGEIVNMQALKAWMKDYYDTLKYNYQQGLYSQKAQTGDQYQGLDFDMTVGPSVEASPESFSFDDCNTELDRLAMPSWATNDHQEPATAPTAQWWEY